MKKPSNPPIEEEIAESILARADHPLIETDLDTLQPGVPQTVRVQLAPIHCWKCGARIKAVRGYVFGDPEVPDEQVFTARRDISDTRQLIWRSRSSGAIPIRRSTEH
jgi:hypothetical protein